MADHEPRKGTATVDLGTRIRKRREELKLSRAQLADRMKARGRPITDQQIYRWEAEGVIPRNDNAAALEWCLEVAPGWIGHGELAAARTTLTHSELLSLLEDEEASREVRDQLTRHLQSRESANEQITATYVIGYLRGARETHAARASHDSARNAQAAGVMIDEGRHPLPETKRKEVR